MQNLRLTMIHKKQIESQNVRLFRNNKITGYVCTKCGKEVSIDDSFSDRGFNLICVPCAYKRAVKAETTIYDWVKENIHDRNKGAR